MNREQLRAERMVSEDGRIAASEAIQKRRRDSRGRLYRLTGNRRKYCIPIEVGESGERVVHTGEAQIVFDLRTKVGRVSTERFLQRGGPPVLSGEAYAELAKLRLPDSLHLSKLCLGSGERCRDEALDLTIGFTVQHEERGDQNRRYHGEQREYQLRAEAHAAMLRG